MVLGLVDRGQAVRGQVVLAPAVQEVVRAKDQIGADLVRETEANVGAIATIDLP